MAKRTENKKKPSISSIYQVFLDNESALKGFLRRFLYKQEDIEEIAQETFLRAYQATQGRDIESPRAYIFKVARRLAFDELARNTRKLTDHLAEIDEYGENISDTLEDEMESQQQIRLYFDAIAGLPSECRQVFLMRKVQGLPYKEIAKKLGVTTKTVEYHLSMGAVRCKHYIKSKHQEADVEKGVVVPAKFKPKGQQHEV